MKSISFILLLFFLSSCVSVVNQPTLILSNEVMYIGDRISHKQANQIRKEADNIKYIVLQSPGGQLTAAFTIARLVRENGMITIIPKNGYCSSACTVIFQAGIERHAGSNAKLLYHGARLGRAVMNDYYEECIDASLRCLVWYEYMRVRTLASSEKLFDTLILYGMDKSFIARYRNWDKDPNWAETGNFLGIADLQINAVESMKYNIVTKIVNYEFK